MHNDAIQFLAETQETPNWERLGLHLPYEWIEQAISYTGKASIRQRRLPAEQVVWLVVALALYRHQSISEVLDNLDLALPDSQAPFVSKSAVAQARQNSVPISAPRPTSASYRAIRRCAGLRSLTSRRT